MKKLIRNTSLCVLFAASSLHAMAQDVLRVGTTPTGAPFTFINTKTGQTEGFMADLIEAIAKDNGFKVDMQPMQFSTLVPSLQANKIDVISAAISATEPRKKVVDFSNEVYAYGEGLMVPASDKKDYTSVQDMKGDRVGAVVGTNYLDVMKGTGVFKEVTAYDNTADIMRDIEAGRLEGGFADGPILAYYFSQNLNPKLRFVKTYKPMVVGLGISVAVRKDEQPLLQKINASIAKFKADGTTAMLLKKWNLSGQPR